MIAIELASAILLAISIGMLWFAWPKSGQKASFLKRESVEVIYTLGVLFLLTGGLGGMLLGVVG
jgi:uncharacterized membrane protein SpoIIM required for sporulation